MKRFAKISALCAALCLLGAACKKAPAPPRPEWKLEKPLEQLAAELVRTATKDTMFKATYEDLTDIYELDMDAIYQLVVYLPDADGNNLLCVGEAVTEEKAGEMLESLKAFQGRFPVKGGLSEIEGSYVLLVASENNDAVKDQFKDAITQVELGEKG